MKRSPPFQEQFPVCARPVASLTTDTASIWLLTHARLANGFCRYCPSHLDVAIKAHLLAAYKVSRNQPSTHHTCYGVHAGHLISQHTLCCPWCIFAFSTARFESTTGVLESFHTVSNTRKAFPSRIIRRSSFVLLHCS